MRLVAELLADERGQGLGEYALILALIAAVCLAAIVLIGANITSLLRKISTAL